MNTKPPLRPQTVRPIFIGVLLAVFLIAYSIHAAAIPEAIVGEVRVQALSPTLVRIEQKGPKGFENRKTLTVMSRDWAGLPLKIEKKNGKVLLTTSAYQVEISDGAKDLAGIVLRSASGKVLHTVSEDDLEFGFLPSPGKMPKVWVMPDVPRLVPPAWGWTVAPDSCTENKETSGWDDKNQAQDLYLFVPQADYAAFRQEFLKLTGPVPLPPLYTFGLWFSRYYPYSDKQMLDLVDEFRAKGFPIDLMVCDTDWRMGKSHGYTANPKLFPDMAGYIAKAHEKNVRTMFNDHPEAQSPGVFDPKEIAYREQGLNSLLNIGADVWWYDRNWNKHLKPPEGLNLSFWGMVVYHDITLKNRPDRRPLIMSNVEGIQNGASFTPSHPAAHRYPIWWTGDTLAFWHVLRSGIENGVNGGIDRLMPYINEDLGGHILEEPPEQFIRSFQFGVFSPVVRPHSTPDVVRYPWAYGSEAEKICREYMQLRYRLLPMIYTAARHAHDTGAPLLQRCDLQWPKYPEAADGLQYLFGEDLLIAPQCYNGLDAVPVALLKTPEAKPGVKAEYFNNEKFEGKPKLVRTENKIAYHYSNRPGGLAKENVSVRWSGVFGPVAETAEYEFGLLSLDGSKLWIGDTQLIARTQTLKSRHSIGITTGRIKLEAGKTYPIKVEFFQKKGGECNLFFGSASKIDDKAHQTRSLWLPPGRWQDAWTGETLTGPTTITVTSDLEHTPIYVREGGMVVTTPLRMHTGIPMWDNLQVDAFVSADTGATEREIYEDDGVSNGYLNKKFSRTHMTMNTENGKTTLRIAPAEGEFLAKDFKRNWTLRLHLPAGQSPSKFSVNGERIQQGKAADKGVSVALLKPAAARVFPFPQPGTAPGLKSGDVAEIFIPNYPADKALTIEIVP